MSLSIFERFVRSLGPPLDAILALVAAGDRMVVLTILLLAAILWIVDQHNFKGKIILEFDKKPGRRR